MSLAVHPQTETAWAVLDRDHQVVVILSGADAPEIAAEYREDGFEVVLIHPES